MRNLFLSLLIFLIFPIWCHPVVIGGGGTGGGPGSDTTTIHIDTADEFSGAAQVTPNSDDRLLLESDGNSLEKRYTTVGQLPTGTGMASFDVTGNVGSAETITNGENLSFAGDNGLTSTSSATNKITYGLDVATSTNIGTALTHVTSNGDDHAYIDQTLVSGASPTFGGSNITGVYGTSVTLNEIGTATYDDIQDFFNISSSGLLTGGAVTDNGDGTAAIASGTGKINSTSSAMGAQYFFDFVASSSIALTDNSTNYIYIDYNSGSPTIAVTLTPEALDQRSQFVKATVQRVGTDLHVVNGGQFIENFQNKLFLRQFRLGPTEKASGAVVSETGTRQLDVTAGKFYYALNYNTTSAKDTSGADTFKAYHRDGGGGWTRIDSQTQINNTQYDNGTGTLATLTVNRYGVHWVYMVLDETINGELHTVFGRGDYTLAQAEAETAPSDLPNEIANIGTLLAKIIIQNGASSFTSILNVNGGGITFRAASDHGGLAGLSDDDHTQYVLVDGTRAMTGVLSGTGVSMSATVTANKFTDGTASLTGGDLSGVGTLTATTITDGTISITGGNLTGATGVTATNLTGTLQTASQTNITAVGTIGTGTWQGTAVADTYVANDLTISGGTVNNTPIGASSASTAEFTDVTANAIYAAEQIYTASTSNSPSTTGVTINFNTGEIHSYDLESTGGDISVTLSNVITGNTYVVEFIQGATARQFSALYPPVSWIDNTTPNISTTENASTICTFSKTPAGTLIGNASDYY